jgi:hypothetical protein
VRKAHLMPMLATLLAARQCLQISLIDFSDGIVLGSRDWELLRLS